MLDLCLLGTGGTLPMPDRALSAGYVRVRGRGLLLDCGEGTQVGIRRLGWGFRCIDGLLISHYHGDHCTGLPGLLLSLGKAERTDPFHIWGGPGLSRVVSGLRVVAPQLPFPVVLHELDGRTATWDVIGLTVTAFPLAHGIPCYGWQLELPRQAVFQPEKARTLGVPVALWKRLQAGERVETASGTVEPAAVLGAPRKGLRMVWATDTRPVEDIVRYGTEADLMVLEGMYGDEAKLPQALANGHMLFREAAELAARARAKQLILTHFSTCVEDPSALLPAAQSVFPGAQAGEDGMTLTLRYTE